MQIRTILTILFASVLIIIFSISTGIRFVSDNIQASQETDLTLVADIADHFISSEIERLRLRASIAVKEISNIAESEWPGVLLSLETQYSEFTGMVILDEEMGIIASAGTAPAPAEIINDAYIKRAFWEQSAQGQMSQGQTSFSSTYPSSQGVVFYLASPMPITQGGNRILVLTLPGMYFSQIVSTFVIWETGHIFMADAEGNIIANMRENWVQTRINFFTLAEADNTFAQVAAVLERVISGQPGIGYFPMDGVVRLCSFGPVSASQEGWSMGIIAPLPESPLRSIDRGLVMVGVVAFALSIVVAIIASSFIKKPFEEIAALKEAAEMNSKSKSTFLANMSHEMRTPMNAIIGMTSIGKNTHELEKKDYAFEKIENASIHLLGVINDVLDMSKIEANKLELSTVTYNFENMLHKVVNVISLRIDERKQEFTVNIDKDIPRFLIGDDQRLAQVIANLLSNAAKFTPDGGKIRLNAKYNGKKDDLNEVQIEVIDSGIGISKDQQQKLFGSYEQAETGTARKFGGTGLGLAISKRIIELMRGNIWIESEIGKGAKFSFTFLAQEGHGTYTNMLAPEAIRKNFRILVVDDNKDVLDYFKDIMKRFGIRGDIALNGEHALAKIEKSGFYNLYFVDWQMPGMDGFELSRKIKQITSNESVIIMISGARWDLIESDARTAGVDKFLPKPLFPSSIVDVINECLRDSNLMYVKDAEPSAADNFEAYTILLAEDVDINREIFLTLLEPTGLNIECAENGMEAVEKYIANPEKYNVILMDIQMPEMDGYEATSRIRAYEETKLMRRPPGVPIIAMTANVFKEDIEKCLSVGMNDHLGKPLDISEVIKKLRLYLQPT